MKNLPLDERAAEAHLMNLLSVEGITGEEKAIAEAVTAAPSEGRGAGGSHPVRQRP